MKRYAFAFPWKAQFAVGLIALSAACTFQAQPAITPTFSVTQAYQTVEARLTQAVAQTPPASPTPEESATPTKMPSPAPSQTPTPQPPTPTLVATAPCDLAAAGFPIDITIPDDSELQPGQSFTKIWRLRNAGTCTWTRAYAAVWFSGEMLAAQSSVLVPKTVNPGESVEIAVDMTAPGVQGTFQSNWKLRNEAGLLFGIGPSGESPFWVRIKVVETPTSTPPPSPQPTQTPTASTTPQVQATGSLSLVPGDQVDLDSVQLNPGGGDDLIYQLNASNNALLTPLGNARLGVHGGAVPSRQDCLAASLSNASLPVQSLVAGSYLCYLTDQGMYGWLQLAALDAQSFTLDVNALTWAPAPP